MDKDAVAIAGGAEPSPDIASNPRADGMMCGVAPVRQRNRMKYFEKAQMHILTPHLSEARDTRA